MILYPLFLGKSYWNFTLAYFPGARFKHTQKIYPICYIFILPDPLLFDAIMCAWFRYFSSFANFFPNLAHCALRTRVKGKLNTNLIYRQIKLNKKFCFSNHYCFIHKRIQIHFAHPGSPCRIRAHTHTEVVISYTYTHSYIHSRYKRFVLSIYPTK